METWVTEDQMESERTEFSKCIRTFSESLLSRLEEGTRLAKS